MKKNNVAGFIAGGSVLLSLLVLLSGFILSVNKISGSDIDDGQYVIETADPGSFKVLSDDYKARQFAVDKHHAYCGNLIIPDFNPGAEKLIGNGYFTDNRNTIYCASFTKQNKAITGWEKLRETWLHGWDLVGKQMPDADPNTLTAIDVQQSDLSVRKSHAFYRDNRNVYYQHDKLPLKSNASLYGFYIGNLFQEVYVFDPHSGLVAMNNILFPPEFSPTGCNSARSPYDLCNCR